MHGRDTVSEGISIFDIIVNERSFVEALDAHCGAFDPMRKTGGDSITIRSGGFAIQHRVIGSQRDERPRVLAAPRQEICG